MPSFEDLGLRPELVRALGEADLDQPTAIQEAVIPALRRGGNLVARASTGSGKTLAYALGVLDRLTTRETDSDEASVTLRVLVLVPTAAAAERVAVELFSYSHAVGLALTVPGGSWGTPASEAEMLVATPADVMEAVRGAALKLDGLEAVIIDDAAALEALGGWEVVDSLLDLVPRDAQRVVISAAFPPGIEDVVERRVKRALRYPAEPALADERRAPAEGRIGYVLVPLAHKLDVLTRQLSQPEERGAPPVIFCANDDRAADLAEQLSVRGFVVGAADDSDADVAVAASDTTREDLLADAGDSLGQTVSFDVPPDARTMLARHGGDEDAVVLITPRELAHLKETAGLARLRAVPVPLPVDRAVANRQLGAFRDDVRRAAREEDLSAQMLVIEPLFDEFSAAEIAAALTALLRRRTPPAATAKPEAAPAPASRAPEAGPAPATWARLYVGVGSRDDVRPGDLVGALAGEAGIPGSAVGRIEIRDNFSVIDVQSALADRVIKAVNGTTIKGRSVRVDYDRVGSRQSQGRRMTRKPPRE